MPLKNTTFSQRNLSGHSGESHDAEGEEVTDRSGEVLRLTSVLGRGAQGDVYGTENGQLAVKLLKHGRRRRRLADRLASVRRLPLGEVPIARPLSMLREPHLGYVMQWMTGMVPLDDLFAPEDASGASPLAFYTNSGGLRRRLRLLAKLADALAGLHARGLIYSDPSPGNLFVSKEPEHNVVRLIDADNLHFESDAERTIYTPFWGAPEVVRGDSGNNSLTDAHAFATLAFKCLSMAHPFLAGEEADASPENEEAALRGELPWIYDEDEDRNRAIHGLPYDAVLSRRLKELFQQTFGPGRTDPLKRPGMATWAQTLHQAADMTVDCPQCQWSYYANRSECVRCDRPRPDVVAIQFHRWLPRTARHDEALTSPAAIQMAVLEAGHERSLGARYLLDAHGEADRLHLALSKDGAQLTAASQRPKMVFATDDWGREKSVSARGTAISLPPRGTAEWSLHLGPRDQSHRVLRFKVFGGNR